VHRDFKLKVLKGKGIFFHSRGLLEFQQLVDCARVARA